LNWAHESIGSAHGRLVHSRRVQVLAGHFAELIPASHTVLDVGCGDGLIDRLILERRPDLQLEGVDVLVRPGARIPVTPFDGRRLPFEDRSWDTVLFCDVLHHTDDPAGMLREAARVARRSILIKDHTVAGFLARPTLRFMDFIGNAPHGVVLPYNYLTRTEWVHIFGSCRLDVKELRTRLGLYPGWADPIFGRSLHFVAALNVGGNAGD
jgi:SAM-dependent methyltransferase